MKSRKSCSKIVDTSAWAILRITLLLEQFFLEPQKLKKIVEKTFRSGLPKKNSESIGVIVGR